MQCTMHEFGCASSHSYNLIKAYVDAFSSKLHLIEEAAAYSCDEYDTNDLFVEVLKGQATFWDLPNSFVITKFFQFPKGIGIHIWVAGGLLDEILASTNTVMTYAKSKGCVRATASGRPGWIRSLKNSGWFHSGTEVMLLFNDDEGDKNVAGK